MPAQDADAIARSIEVWKAKAHNYLTDLADSTLVGDTRAAIRNALNHAHTMVAELEAERAHIMAGMIDREREQAAYQDILAWCKQVKGAREELSYQRKRDFLHMLGVVVVVNNTKPYYTNLVYRMEITLPTIAELVGPNTLRNCDTPSGDGVGSPLG